MSFQSGLRKFKPGNTAHIRRPWRAFVIIGLMGLVGLVLLLVLRGSHYRVRARRRRTSSRHIVGSDRAFSSRTSSPKSFLASTSGGLPPICLLLLPYAVRTVTTPPVTS